MTAATGSPHSAAKLLGGAASLRERSDVPVDDVDAADVRRAYERTRPGLDAEIFAATDLSGKKLRLTQLLDLARAPGHIEASRGGEPVDDRSRSDQSSAADLERNRPVSGGPRCMSTVTVTRTAPMWRFPRTWKGCRTCGPPVTASPHTIGCSAAPTYRWEPPPTSKAA